MAEVTSRSAARWLASRWGPGGLLLQGVAWALADLAAEARPLGLVGAPAWSAGVLPQPGSAAAPPLEPQSLV